MIEGLASFKDGRNCFLGFPKKEESSPYTGSPVLLIYQLHHSEE
jgi:hypothetical protein